MDKRRNERILRIWWGYFFYKVIECWIGFVSLIVFVVDIVWVIKWDFVSECNDNLC